MKTALKTLGLLLFVIVTMVSCATDPRDLSPKEPWPPTVNPDDYYKLHHIRPTKPIRIPDTMAILPRPATLESPLDTTLSNSQDSVPQE